MALVRIDWTAAIREALRLEAMEPDARQSELGNLAGADPQLAQLLDAYLTQTADFSGFMATRAPGECPLPSPLADPDSLIGPWRLVSLVGTGGMGQVWQARRDDGFYDQIAALKLLAADNAPLRDRFSAERRRLAQLEHPHIARIIDGGEDATGRPYMVMEYVAGERVDSWCEAKRASRAQRLSLLADLCAALAHAHARLVLHLDIKAANVLINADGHVRLIDFGVAALLDAEGATNPVGALTLATAAPEQLAGQPVSAATDIFQVGVLAHYLLVDRMPHRQADGSVRIDGAALRDQDLVAIIVKACAADPRERYGSAEAMGDDLRSWLAGMPVSAREGGGLYRTAKAVRRYPVAFGLAALLILSLIVGISVSINLLRTAQEARNDSEFFLAESRRDNKLSSVWADLMQRAFGNSADQDRLASFLLAHNEKLRASATEQPEEAAMTASAIGQHFMFRNDYPRAIEVLEPWITSGYGSTEFLFGGRGMLARSLMDVGREADAVKLLRQNLSEYASRRDRYQASHAATASQLALLTKADADVADAKSVLLATLELNEETAPAGYLENQMALMHRLEGDFAQTRTWLERSLKKRLRPAATVTDVDTTLLNLAVLELSIGVPAARLQERLDQIDKMLAAKGASATNARRAALQAELDLITGNLPAALASIEKAEAGFRTFVGEGTPAWARSRFRRAEILAMMGRGKEARDLLRSVDYDHLSGSNRIVTSMWEQLAALTVDAADPSKAMEIWAPSAMQLRELCVHPELLRHYADHAKRGYAAELPCMARLKAAL